MPSLIEQELARRDANLGRSSATGPRTYLPPAIRARNQQFQSRLQQRDEEDAARNAILHERLDLERAANERKTTTSEGRRQIAEDALKSLQESRVNEEKIRQLKQDVETERQATKADRTAQILDQAKQFLHDARGMDPHSKKFTEQYQNLLDAYPAAAEHPAVKEWNTAHVKMHQDFMAKELAKEEEAAKQQTAKAGVQQAYSRTLGKLSGYYEEKKDKPNDHALAADIADAEESIRSMESLNPSLRATRNLPGEQPVVPQRTPIINGTNNAPVTIGGPSPTTIELPPSTETAPVEPVVAPFAEATPPENPNLGQDDSALAPIQQVATAPAPPAASPTAQNDPMVELANQALADPNAKPHHKEAATRYLNSLAE